MRTPDRFIKASGKTIYGMAKEFIMLFQVRSRFMEHGKKES